MNRQYLWKRIEQIGIAILLLFIFVLAVGIGQTDVSRGDELLTLGSGWYRIVDGEKAAVTLPDSLKGKKGETILLYNDTLTWEDAGKTFSADGVSYGLEIRLGDTLLYRYEDNSFPKNAQMKGKLWADIELPEETGQEPLCIAYIADGKEMMLNAPLLGSSRAVTGWHLKNSLFSACMICGMAGLGILSLIVFAYLKKHKIEEPRFLNVALFLGLCSLWSLTDSGLFRIYAGDTAAWSLVSFYAFMLMPVPVLHFVEHTLSSKRRLLPALFVLLLYGNALGQGILYLAFGIPYIQMLWFTHVLLTAGVAAMIGVLYKSELREKREDIRLCLHAFSMLGISGVLALILYWGLGIHWYDVVFQFGIILFIGLLFWGIICRVAEDIRFRMEQTIEDRMASEDRMTGLQNRWAFEQYLEELKQQEEKLRDVMLTYVHLEGLKRFNDLYGLSAGNEAVIGVARCLARLQEDTGFCFRCFRIDGDEFALVYPDPVKSAEELEQSVQSEIERYNKTVAPRGKLEVSCGTGYLHRRNGVIRTVSDWKSKADFKLQENRKETGGNRDDKL